CRRPAVIGQPDAERAELVRALVVPQPGARLEVRALENHCEQHLRPPKRPRLIKIVAALPKNFLGKVHRHLLRARTAPAHEVNSGQSRNTDPGKRPRGATALPPGPPVW